MENGVNHKRQHGAAKEHNDEQTSQACDASASPAPAPQDQFPQAQDDELPPQDYNVTEADDALAVACERHRILQGNFQGNFAIV